MQWGKIHLTNDDEFSVDELSISIELEFLDFCALPTSWVTFKRFCIVALNNLVTTSLSDIEANSPIVL